jgi:hypothetical protein
MTRFNLLYQLTKLHKFPQKSHPIQKSPNILIAHTKTKGHFIKHHPQSYNYHELAPQPFIVNKAY